MRRLLIAASLALAIPAIAQADVFLPKTGTYNAGQPVFCVNPATAVIEDCVSGGTQPSPQAVTPAAGTAHAIVTGGTAVTFVTGPLKGCYIQNPLTATDEGIGAVEPLYVNIVTTATTSSLNGTSTALAPGQTFNCVPGQTTNVSANAATSAHNAVVVVW